MTKAITMAYFRMHIIERGIKEGWSLAEYNEIRKNYNKAYNILGAHELWDEEGNQALVFYDDNGTRWAFGSQVAEDTGEVVCIVANNYGDTIQIDDFNVLADVVRRWKVYASR